MPHLKIRDANLYYEDEGTGDPIVFAHSMLFNLRMFDDQVNLLKSTHRCVRFDFRGQGSSEVTAGGYDLDSLSKDAIALIKALGCGPCHFVGFSMGGMVAMRLADKHPDMIKSLILIDTSSESQDDMLRNRLLIWVAKHFGIKILANKVMSMFFSAGFLRDKKRQSLVKTWKKHFLANDAEGILKVIKPIVFRKSITHLLDSIKHPALILVGEKDILTDIEKARIMHKHLEHSEIWVVPRSGHMAPVEEPEFVNHQIRDFINRVSK